MNGHLALLRALLRVVDPQLMAYLGASASYVHSTPPMRIGHASL